MSEILNVKQFAERFSVSLPTAYKLCARDDFPAIRIGRAIRIPEDGLADWLEAHRGQDVLGGAAEV